MTREQAVKRAEELYPIDKPFNKSDVLYSQSVNQSRLLQRQAYLKGWEESQKWTKVEDGLPDELETVWISNGKGWTTLGCRVYEDGDWHWAESNGTIYEEDGKIVSECESDDLDVQDWKALPEPPK